LFTRVLSPIHESSQQQQQNNTPTCCVHRLLHYGALTILSVAIALLFIQTQAISLRLASQQQQIDSLGKQLSSSTEHIEHEVEAQRDLTVIHIAGTFTLLSCLITLFHMTAHLRKMNQPFVQRKILAILWMSPIYALASFLSLVLPHSADGYLMMLKDFYESYVIYQFISFLIAVVGRGDRDAVVRCLTSHIDHLDKPYRWLGCLFHPSPEESDEAMARAVLMECQVLGLQFVFLRPVIAMMEFVLDILSQEDSGVSDEDKGRFSFLYSPKFVLLMVQNISVFFAFSGLLKLYHALRDELAWCQPFNKFLTIKGVVFMTFWQGLAINIFFNLSKRDSSGVDDDVSTIPSANTVQHILICMEMLFFSIAHWCVFPAEEWEVGYKVQYYQGPGFAFRDFASDVSLIIDDGKRSIRARRESKQNGSVNSDAMTSSGLPLNGRESPSFGSLDDSSNQGREESDDHIYPTSCLN
jgi:hypothetical protein